MNFFRQKKKFVLVGVVSVGEAVNESFARNVTKVELPILDLRDVAEFDTNLRPEVTLGQTPFLPQFSDSLAKFHPASPAS